MKRRNFNAKNREMKSPLSPPPQWNKKLIDKFFSFKMSKSPAHLLPSLSPPFFSRCRDLDICVRLGAPKDKSSVNVWNVAGRQGILCHGKNWKKKRVHLPPPPPRFFFFMKITPWTLVHIFFWHRCIKNWQPKTSLIAEEYNSHNYLLDIFIFSSWNIFISLILYKVSAGLSSRIQPKFSSSSVISEVSQWKFSLIQITEWPLNWKVVMYEYNKFST